MKIIADHSYFAPRPLADSSGLGPRFPSGTDRTSPLGCCAPLSGTSSPTPLIINTQYTSSWNIHKLTLARAHKHTHTHTHTHTQLDIISYEGIDQHDYEIIGHKKYFYSFYYLIFFSICKITPLIINTQHMQLYVNMEKSVQKSNCLYKFNV